MRSLATILALLLVAGLAFAGDLYKVEVQSQLDAHLLSALGVEPVAHVTGGYLVIVDASKSDRLADSRLAVELLLANVDKSELALDNRLDKANVWKYPVLYQEGDFRLFRVTRAELSVAPTDLQPIRSEGVVIQYDESSDKTAVLARLSSLSVPLDSLVGLVSQDSLASYVSHLQSFPSRLASQPGNAAARDWLVGQFRSFGYDSLRLDTFVASISTAHDTCENILAYKIGQRFPNHYVILCAHRDDLPPSPGADDNGSGTAAVLELARVLKDIPTDMTIIFALWDAEEYGLIGSSNYAYTEAAVRGDSIVYVLNLDMIGYYRNTTAARVYHGIKKGYSELWIRLTDSVVGISGSLYGSSSASDHYPFTQRGYEASFVQEGIFSTVYHTVRDSSTYLNFEYMAKLVKASLATGYTVSQTAGPAPGLAFDFPEALPVTIDPGRYTNVAIDISSSYGGSLIAGSEKLHYSVNTDAYRTAPLTKLSPLHYVATLPAVECNAHLRYYITADEATSGTLYDTDVAFPHEAVPATYQYQLFQDNCEFDRGWTVSGNALDGEWMRMVPAGYNERGAPPTSFGGSGWCWMTDCGYGDSDVDGGSTYLTSPAIDLSWGDARIHFALWYSNSTGTAPHEDVFRVYVSNDNGVSWQLAMTVGPSEYSDGGWLEYTFWVGDYAAPTPQTRIRFEASDLNNESVVEAAIDDITVTHFQCVPLSCCFGSTGNVNMAGIVDLADLSTLIAYFYGQVYPLPCDDEANVDTQGIIDLSDLSLLIAYLTASPRPTLPPCP